MLWGAATSHGWNEHLALSGSAVSLRPPSRYWARSRSRRSPRALFTELRVQAGSLSVRSEEHTSELQSLMRISYAVFCLKKKTHTNHHVSTTHPYTIFYT